MKAAVSLRPLRPEHATFVCEQWPHSAVDSEHLLRTTLHMNKNLSWGTFDPDADGTASTPLL